MPVPPEIRRRELFVVWRVEVKIPKAHDHRSRVRNSAMVEGGPERLAADATVAAQHVLQNLKRSCPFSWVRRSRWRRRRRRRIHALRIRVHEVPLSKCGSTVGCPQPNLISSHGACPVVQPSNHVPATRNPPCHRRDPELDALVPTRRGGRRSFSSAVFVLARFLTELRSAPSRRSGERGAFPCRGTERLAGLECRS